MVLDSLGVTVVQLAVGRSRRARFEKSTPRHRRPVAVRFHSLLPDFVRGGPSKKAPPKRGSRQRNNSLALVIAVLAALMASLNRNFRVSFFALVFHVAPDGA